MLRKLVIPVLVLAVTAACSDSKEEVFPAACHLPSPSPGVGLDDAPEEMIVIPGTVVRSVTRERGLLVIALNIPASVGATNDAYLDALRPPRYQEISSENEGFEAESYFRDTETGDFVAVQIRNPGCDQAVAAFVSLGTVDSPVGGSATAPPGSRND